MLRRFLDQHIYSEVRSEIGIHIYASIKSAASFGFIAVRILLRDTVASTITTIHRLEGGCFKDVHCFWLSGKITQFRERSKGLPPVPNIAGV